jgi:hypothetical protein
MAEVCGLMNVVPLMAVRLFYFFLDKKVTKNQVSKRLLTLRASALQISQNLGCNLLPYFVRSSPCFCKICYALLPHLGHHCFG